MGLNWNGKILRDKHPMGGSAVKRAKHVGWAVVHQLVIIGETNLFGGGPGPGPQFYITRYST